MVEYSAPTGGIDDKQPPQSAPPNRNSERVAPNILIVPVEIYPTVVRILTPDGRSEGNRMRNAHWCNRAAGPSALTALISKQRVVSRFEGLFRSRIPNRYADVSDGTSHSIMIGENLGLISARVRDEINPWFFAVLSRGRSDLEWRESFSNRTPGLELLGDDWFSHQAGFASKHAAGVNFSFIDGSCRMLARTIDVDTMYSLSGIGDGEN